MKPFRLLLPTAAVALLASGWFHPGLSRAADDDAAARRASAEELLQTMHLQQLVDDTFNRMGQGIDALSERSVKQAAGVADPSELQVKIRTEAREMLRKEFSWDVLKPEFAQVYVDAFTDAELKDLIAFYKTPTGQKLVAKQPELSSKMARFIQARAVAATPLIRQKIQELTQQAPKTATPSPAPTAPVAPGASPAPAATPAAAASPAATPAAPAATPAVHSGGKSEPGTP